MYIPECFKITDERVIIDFIEANAFGQLISTSEGRLFSTHIPFILSDDKSKLLFHLAAKNPQVQAIDAQEVLVTLQGEHGYISPTWYANPGVPTWNYQAVHVYGRCKVSNEAAMLERIISSLTEKYESRLPNPWESEYNPAMLNAIVGIELSISEVQCQYKLSQNRSKQDRQKVIAELNKNGSKELAKHMQKNE